MQVSDVVSQPVLQPSLEDDILRRRICEEFTEMPGLKLTIPQAARLFSLERRRCERILRVMVRVGTLASDGTSYWRTRHGR